MTKVPCEKCSGCGARELYEHEAETLKAAGDDWKTTAEISAGISMPSNISIPALNNRLVRLEALGLVERRPIDGKHYEWRAVKTRARKAG